MGSLLLLACLAAAPSDDAVARLEAHPPAVGQTLDVTAEVESVYRCTCPPGAECKLCPGPLVRLRGAGPKPAELTVRVPENPPAEVAAGARIRLVARVVEARSGREGLTVERPAYTVVRAAPRPR